MSILSLNEALHRVDPELTDYLRPDVKVRARCAAILANAHIRAARRDRRECNVKYVELLKAASLWTDPYPTTFGRKR